ncbi:biotin apo-protein ligase-related protein-like protein [Chthoniobacter flavus Ellin428]|uniref:Biotin apo-protein ligase-related protein-like protein n=1 Tax=Chthoniobacter flavus Ellin428 TaxID=497964 RepID=B4D9S9_9BACT|nr:BPL-N domain-containing protein [Chthoniobacter flavus]EDY16860.1 biotin apo-protein ligase-related protein-like protein [Chthoniobacter flavus Ellin428]TCO93317.1 biotin protein ligase-like protein [Chthoniobacter flavus]
MKSFPRPFCCLAVILVFLGSIAARAENATPVRVALYEDAGAAGKGVPYTKAILTQAGCTVTVFKAEDLSHGVLENKDVVVFTGGSGSKEGNSIGDAGREVVKKFVREGGGYLGICAGAYLACSKFTWSLGLLDAQTVSQKWRRGRGDVEMELTPEGQRLTALPAEKKTVRYDNGPIIKPAGRTDLTPYEPLALFRTEMAENGTPAGVMVNSPAIVKGQFGKGRVIISSPHPEQTPGLEIIVEQAVHWLAGGEKP